MHSNWDPVPNVTSSAPDQGDQQDTVDERAADRVRPSAMPSGSGALAPLLGRPRRAGERDAGDAGTIDKVSQAPSAPDLQGYELDTIKDMTLSLARDAKTPDAIVSACSMKTVIWALTLMRQGVPANALRFAGAFGTDLSAQGLASAYRSGNVMSAPSRFAPLTLEERVARSRKMGAHADGPRGETLIAGKWPISAHPYQGRPGVMIGNRWNVPQQGPTPFINHFALAVMTIDRHTGAIAPMVIDLAHNRTGPIGLNEWKARLNHSGAVLALSPIDESFRIDVSTLDTPALERLRDCLALPHIAHASRDDIARIIANQPEPERRALLARFFNPRTSDRTQAGLPRPSQGDTAYASTLSAIIADGLRPMNGSFRTAADMRHYQGVLEAEIAPLVAYEQWLISTDQDASATRALGTE